MARRGVLIKKHRQISQFFSNYITDIRSPKVSSLLSKNRRTCGFLADFERVPACLTYFSKVGIPDVHCALGTEGRPLVFTFEQEVRHSFSSKVRVCIQSLDVLSGTSARRLLSTPVNGDNSLDIKRDQKYLQHGATPAEQTSNTISRMLKTWTANTPTELASLGVPWNPFIVCGVFKSNIRAESAWEFFNWVSGQEGYCHNVYTYTAMIDQFGKARNYSAMESLVEKMRQEGHDLSVVTYTTLIHWYRHARNLDGARKVWNEMGEKAVRPSVFTYTAYIDALVRGNQHLEAMEIFRQMQEGGCRPNIYTYTVLIYSLVEAGKLDEATELFDKLEDVDCKPNSVTYSLLISAHSKAGNLKKVLSLFRAMRECGVGVTKEQRSTVARALVGVGMVEESEQLLAGVDENNILLKLHSRYTIADEHLETPGHERAVSNWLPKPKHLARKLRVWGPETDASLEKIGRRLKPPYVMNVLKELQTNAILAWQFFKWAEAQEGYKHTQYTYMKMVEIAGRASKVRSPELMDMVLAELERATVDLERSNTLIKYHSECKNVAAAEQVFNRLNSVGCKPSETTYTLLIDMYSKAGLHTKSLNVYEEMQKAECKPTMHTYRALMHSLTRSGRISEAETIFDSLPSLGYKPNVTIYTVQIQSFFVAGEVDKAIALAQRMKDAKMRPTQVTLKVIAKGLRNAGRVEEAQKIADSLPYVRGMLLQPGDLQRLRKSDKEVLDLMSSIFSQSTELPVNSGEVG